MKKENLYNFIISTVNENIKYYKKRLETSTTNHERMHYDMLLYTEISCLNNWILINNERQIPNILSMKEFTLDELSQFDGSEGKPAYVAVNGIVYDVGLEATWGGGTHFSLYAGKDLSEEFNSCHKGVLEVLRNLPKVGILLEEKIE